jgi:hypothetical protein
MGWDGPRLLVLLLLGRREGDRAVDDNRSPHSFWLGSAVVSKRLAKTLVELIQFLSFSHTTSPTGPSDPLTCTPDGRGWGPHADAAPTSAVTLMTTPTLTLCLPVVDGASPSGDLLDT